jgi:hypothetical protein
LENVVTALPLPASTAGAERRPAGRGLAANEASLPGFLHTWTAYVTRTLRWSVTWGVGLIEAGEAAEAAAAEEVYVVDGV